MNPGNSTTERAISLFYEGVLTPQCWEEGLREVSALAGTFTASILVVDADGGGGRFSEAFGMPQRAAEEYAAYYHRFDPGLAFIDRMGVGDWYLDHRDTGRGPLTRSEYYTDYMLRHGAGSSGACCVLADGRTNGYLSIQREKNATALSEPDIARLSAVTSHLQRALRLRTEALVRRSGAAAVVFDSLRAPVLVVDASGRIEAANASAERACARRMTLRIHGGRLEIEDAHAARWSAILREACYDSGAVAGSLVIGGANGAPVRLVALPVSERLRLRHALKGNSAVAILHDEEADETDNRALLRDIFDLTPAEERLALALASGQAPEAAAQRLGVGVSTVRTHIKSLFSKTGTSRQVDLVRTLTACIALSPTE